MGREDEYRRNAEEAERSAANAKTDQEREAYQQIARGWRDLIAVAERRRNRT